MELITVRPLKTAWAVSLNGADNPMIFFSGARAEQAARSIGRTLAGRGQGCMIEIWLRDGQLAARLDYPAAKGAASLAA